MYNRRKNQAVDTAASLTAFLDKKFPGGDYEILFSNDGSRDRCAELVEKAAFPHVRVVGYPDNRGKGSAIREGIFQCKARLLYILTATWHMAAMPYIIFIMSSVKRIRTGNRFEKSECRRI